MTAKPQIDVAERLKEYAKGQVQFMKEEYDRQLIKWTMYIRDVADAQTKAYNDVKDALTDIKRQQEEEAQRMAQFAMIAFSLVGSIAVSWLSATIQYRLYPRVAALRNPELQRLLHKSTTTWDQYIKAAEKADFSKVAAKMWGDTISKQTWHALDSVFGLTLPKACNDPPKLNIQLLQVVETADFGSYKTSLENTMSSEQLRVSRQFTEWFESIHKMQDFGEMVLAELDKRLPGKFDDKQRELQGMTYLDEYFDEKRKDQTTKWFYYRNNPVESGIHFLASRFDREIWAVWILAQEWVREKTTTNPRFTSPIIYYVTKDGELYLTEIVEALGKFAYRELQDVIFQMGKPDIQVTSDEFDSADALAKATQRVRDADELLKQVIDWAKSNPGAMLHSNLEYRPRNLGTIANSSSVLADN